MGMKQPISTKGVATMICERVGAVLVGIGILLLIALPISIAMTGD
jgi:hypothetical protein